MAPDSYCHAFCQTLIFATKELKSTHKWSSFSR